MDTRGIDQMLSELAGHLAGGRGQAHPGGPVLPAAGEFRRRAASRRSTEVSSAQMQAQEMAKGFSAGDPNVNLQDVMVNLQKASLSFQQMVQVRNKLVTAYQDMMNMSV
jgi:flagellar hook-basal body complex protein FliE